MTIIEELDLASHRAPGLRKFQLLDRHDRARFEAFLLSFDFDQRRAHFGCGVSDESIRNHCRAIDWMLTTIVARSGPCCLEAVAILASSPYDPATAELAVACPLACDQRAIVAELAELAIVVGAVKHRSLIVPRDGIHPDLVTVLREKPFVRFDSASIRIELWARTGDAAAG
jgi:hypothetical protein